VLMDEGGRGHHDVGRGDRIIIGHRVVNHVLLKELDHLAEVHLCATMMDQWPISYARMAEKWSRLCTSKSVMQMVE
jgi:hypothetical protein